jgi:hypothetical protein
LIFPYDSVASISRRRVAAESILTLGRALADHARSPSGWGLVTLDSLPVNGGTTHETRRGFDSSIVIGN